MIQIYVVIVCLGVILVHYKHSAEGSPTTVLTLPGDGRVKRGSPVVLQCRQSMNSAIRGSSSSSIAWYRRYGDVQNQLGVEDFLFAEFGTVSRVKITRDTLGDSVVSNLTISDAHLEDSGVFVCGASPTSSAAKTLSVCVDVDSQLCSCMQSAGAKWPTECFSESYGNIAEIAGTSASTRNKLIGLGIALGCIMLYAIVMSIVASRDCIRQRWRKNKCSSPLSRQTNDDSLTVLGRSPYNDSDVVQLEASDSSSDATASCSATCSSSDNSTAWDNTANRRPVPSAASPTRRQVNAQVHLDADAAPTTVRQDIDRPPTSRSAARCNYGYLDDDDCEDIVPQRHYDWPNARQTRLDSTTPASRNDFEEMSSPLSYQTPSVADPYRRPRPTLREPLSIISIHLSSNTQSDYDKASADVNATDVQLSLNDTSV